MPTHREVSNHRESVFDYPRPPRVEDFDGRVQVHLGGYVVADSRSTKRVLERTHPPVFYIPPADIDTEILVSARKKTFCEFKGQARYYSVHVPGRFVANAAWYYPRPVAAYKDLESYVAFYPSLMDACFVNGEKVEPQLSNFYGGWITSEIDGPFRRK